MKPTIALLMGVVAMASGCSREPLQPTAQGDAGTASPSPSTAAEAERPKAAGSFLGPLPVKPVSLTDSPPPPVGDTLPGAPLSLTSSDGTGLEISSFRARAVIEEPLAFTELHLIFRNPQARQIEGQFEITLPTGATISRFAMKQDSGWQEGEVVELQAARVAYEDFLHRRQDPALMEKKAGNQFRARVFPIPPSGSKELIISYSQELTRSADPYKIFLRGLPQLDNLDIRAIIGKQEVKGGGSSLGGRTLSHQAVEVQKRAFSPDRDFEVPLHEAGQTLQIGLRHENLVVSRIQPVAEAAKQKVESLTVLFDTSASRALGFRAQVERLGSLIDKLKADAGAKLPLRVVCFDQDVEEVFAGAADDFGQKELQKILERRALGASNLGKALEAVTKGSERVIMVTDGIATAGDTEGNKLREAVAKLGPLGVQRLDVVVDGGIRDEPLAKQLVTAGLKYSGTVIDASIGTALIAEKVGRATFSGIKVSVPKSNWVWPTELNGLQPGDEVMVYADLPRDQPLEIVLDGAQAAKHAIPLAQTHRPLLERGWVNARIQRLMHQRDTLAANDQDLREALKKEIISLSTKFRVLSDYTALLVLETEADYARFNIDRRALTDILYVGASGIELLDRKNGQRQKDIPLQLAQNGNPTPTPTTLPPIQGATRGGENKQSANRETPDKPADLSRAQAGDKKRDESSARAAPATKSPGFLGRLFKGNAAEGGAAPAAPATIVVAKPAAAAAAPAPSGPGSGEAAAGSAAAPPPAAAEAPAPPRESLKTVTATPRAEPPAASDPAAVAPPTERPGYRPLRVAPRGAAVGGRVGVGVRVGGGGSAPRVTVGPSTGSSSRGGVAFRRRPPSQPVQIVAEKRPEIAPYQGKLLQVMTLLNEKRAKDALALALKWHDDEPGDVLSLIAIGEAAEAVGNKPLAARAYGSIIDLFPSRADLRRFAGERLDRLAQVHPAALELAIDTFRQARTQRADHPASHRLLAYALVRAGKYADAFDVIVEGSRKDYPVGRFAGVPRILREDVGLIGAVWIRNEPTKRDSIMQRIAQAGAQLATQPSLRFVLNWETDANDVDFHIHDGKGGHAYYSQKQLASGGALYADVTTGYGPECFTIDGASRTYPYRLQAHYYSRGPMGYGMGKLEVLDHDGKGNLKFDERPFVVMTDRAYVDLGFVRGGLK